MLWPSPGVGIHLRFTTSCYIGYLFNSGPELEINKPLLSIKMQCTVTTNHDNPFANIRPERSIKYVNWQQRLHIPGLYSSFASFASNANSQSFKSLTLRTEPVEVPTLIFNLDDTPGDPEVYDWQL